MPRLSRLSRECIANRGLCCEHRTPPFFLPGEVLHSDQETSFSGEKAKRPLTVCPFFKEPFCSVYDKRPVDCRTYPVSLRLNGEKKEFIIDMKCPGVRKGLVSLAFIREAVSLWNRHDPSKGWLEEYHEGDDPENYQWIGIDEYLDRK